MSSKTLTLSEILEEGVTDAELRAAVHAKLREEFLKDPGLQAIIMEEEELLHKLLYGDPTAPQITPQGLIDSMPRPKPRIEESLEAITAVKLNLPFMGMQRPGESPAPRKKWKRVPRPKKT